MNPTALAAKEGEAAQRPALSTGTRTVDFYGLPRAVQQRFLVATAGEGAPAPALFEPSVRASGFVWLAVAAVLGIGLYAISTYGFGDLENPYAVQPLTFLVAYALLWGGATYCLAAFLGVRLQPFSTPYAAGCYLFPIGVVEAADGNIRITGIDQFEELKKDSRGNLELRTKAGAFRFTAPANTAPAELAKWCAQNRDKFHRARTDGDTHAVALMDPLRDSGVSNPLLPETPLARPSRKWPIWLLMALLIGGSFGYASYTTRARLGEQKLYEAALAADTPAAYRAYVERGGLNPEVRALLLPRAELKGIRGNLTELERYAAANPGSRIKAEVEAELRKALLAGLVEVTASGSLARLEQFGREHPTKLVEKEFAQARTQMFDMAYRRYEELGNASALDFFDLLLAYSERHGPRVEVRFRSHLPELSLAIEKTIKASAYFGGNQSLPRQYFDAEHSRAREGKMAVGLLAGLQAPFSPEYLQFVVGEPLPDGDEPLPAVTVPTLFIQHTTNISGGYTNQVPRGVFVGLGQAFRATFVIPGSSDKLETSISFWRPPDLPLLRRDNLKTGEFYDVMAAPAYPRFTRRVLQMIFKDVPKDLDAQMPGADVDADTAQPSEEEMEPSAPPPSDATPPTPPPPAEP